MYRYATTVIVMIAALLATGGRAFAGEYKGVEIGQRGDFLPPEFERVLVDQYDAQFGNELMQVFVRGALVTGMKVVPLAPMTLAEALAAHSKGASPNSLRLLFDFNGGLLGITDTANEIAYFVPAANPDAIVGAVGYYNNQTALMIFTAPMRTQEAEALVDAARKSSPDALNQRPQVKSADQQAEYLVEQATQPAVKQAQTVAKELKSLDQHCKGTPECNSQRDALAADIVRETQRFLVAFRHAEHVYEPNAVLLGDMPPVDLMDLQDSADALLRQVQEAVGPVRFAVP